MRDKILNILERLIGDVPRARRKTLADEIMVAGIENLREELPSKIPLEGIIIYQDKKMKDMESKISLLEGQLSDVEDERNQLMVMSPEEKIKIKSGEFYRGINNDKKRLEGIVKTLKNEKRKYFNQMMEAKRKLLEFTVNG